MTAVPGSLVLLALAALLSGCGGAPAPAPGQAGIAVAVEAAPARAVQERQAERGGAAGYGSGAANVLDAERVDYAHLRGILVTLEGAGLETGGPCPESCDLVVEDAGPRPAVLLLAGGPRSVLNIENATDAAVQVLAISDAGPAFEIELPARGRARQPAPPPGDYAIELEPAGKRPVSLHVVAHRHAALVSTGQEVVFDVPPGRYTVRVVAPRLPVWTRAVTAVAGRIERLEATLSVDLLK